MNGKSESPNSTFCSCPKYEKSQCYIFLTEPKNSLVKQYQKLMKLDNVNLVFDDDALTAIAEKSIRLKTGARGLRSVVEGVMLDCMFDAPSHPDIEEIHITRDCIEGGKQPTIVKKAV